MPVNFEAHCLDKCASLCRSARKTLVVAAGKEGRFFGEIRMHIMVAFLVFRIA